MQGNVIGFDLAAGRGAIGGHDGNRYEFVRGEWRGQAPPVAGAAVDFTASGVQATAVFPVAGARPPFSWGNFLLSPSGRVGRYEYWVKYVVPYTAIYLVLAVVDLAFDQWDEMLGLGLLSGVFFVVALWPGIAIGIKRCHDRDRSGWFLLIILIPLVGAIWLLVELGFLRGTVGDNRFGPDPVAG